MYFHVKTTLLERIERCFDSELTFDSHTVVFGGQLDMEGSGYSHDLARTHTIVDYVVEAKNSGCDDSMSLRRHHSQRILRYLQDQHVRLLLATLNSMPEEFVDNCFRSGFSVVDFCTEGF